MGVASEVLLILKKKKKMCFESTYDEGIVRERVPDLQVLEKVCAPVFRVPPGHRGTDGTHLE